VKVTLWDKDMLTQDDYVGIVDQDFRVGDAMRRHKQNLAVHNSSGKKTGTIKLGLEWLDMAPFRARQASSPTAALNDNLPYILVVSLDRLQGNFGVEEAVQVVAKVGATTKEGVFIPVTKVKESRLEKTLSRVVEKLTDRKMKDKDIADVTGLTLAEVQDCKEYLQHKKKHGDKAIDIEIAIDTIFYFVLDKAEVTHELLVLEVKSKTRSLGVLKIEMRKETVKADKLRRYLIGGYHLWGSISLSRTKVRSDKSRLTLSTASSGEIGIE